MSRSDRSLRRLGERGLTLLALVWLAGQVALGVWREGRAWAGVPAGERRFAWGASATERFERLGDVGRAYLLLERFTPRRADVVLVAPVDAETLRLHNELSHLAWPRALHYLAALPADPRAAAARLSREVWLLELGASRGAGWEAFAERVAEAAPLVLWRVQQEGPP